MPGHADEEPLTDSGKEREMYFKQPKQLLDLFTQLEEQNLFLIQNSQETEQALEELKQDFTATQVSMDGKTSSLRENIGELKSQIGDEEVKAEQLSKSINASTGPSRAARRRSWALYSGYEVYERCGFDVPRVSGSIRDFFTFTE